MPYIGRAATNTGNVRYLDNIASGFDGSDVTFTAQVGGVSITPDQENVRIYLDGVFQHPGSGNAYTISGSTITFTEAPVANTVFSAYVVGAGSYLDDKAVTSAKLDDDAVVAAKLDDDGTGFQVGDLGVGGSLTSGDKLTVTGRLRASGGIIGDLTGDVIGDLTGNVTGNTSGTAATVTGAAQSAITSVGTLTSLATSGVVGITVANVSGVTARTDADDLVIENTAHNGISILTNDDQTGNLVFGQASSNRTARVDYDGNTNIMHVGTTKASGQLQLQSANGTTGITLDASSNTTFAGTIFQGTTSPTLHSAVRGIVFENGALLNDVTRGASKSITLAQNVAIDSGNTWAYLATDEASYYQQFGGNHYFATCASGSAGADATLTLEKQCPGFTKRMEQIANSPVANREAKKNLRAATEIGPTGHLRPH